MRIDYRDFIPTWPAAKSRVISNRAFISLALPEQLFNEGEEKR
jgi:hypothetical protein